VSLVERLDWDSAFFGFPIGRVKSGVTTVELGSVVREADNKQFRCIYLLASAGDQALLESAQRHAFLVRGVRVELERPVAGHRADMDGLRPGSLEDLAKLAPIARETFRDTRFFADQRFPEERSSELYVEWLTQGLRSRGELVSLVTDDASGFVTCRLSHAQGVGSIELIAVASAAGGKGLGSALVAGAGALFSDASLITATVVTQGHNVVAQRLYQAHGYRTRSVDLWLHRWHE
jgi:dTDP-4-amino-4,6-dideoxy-D-galactose acyltransferase